MTNDEYTGLTKARQKTAISLLVYCWVNLNLLQSKSLSLKNKKRAIEFNFNNALLVIL